MTNKLVIDPENESGIDAKRVVSTSNTRSEHSPPINGGRPGVRDEYAWLARLSRIGWAWEFLRRNLEYQRQWRGEVEGAKASDWGLRRFEDPMLDACSATIFWLPEACPAVLPVVASSLEDGQAELDPSSLNCDTHVIPDELSGKADVLFQRDCRFLQIVLSGSSSLAGVQLSASVVPMPKQASGRVLALRRFANLVTSAGLQPNLYPPERRAPRLTKVLRALDCAMNHGTYRDIALLTFGKSRVEAEWSDPRNHLRDQVRRAVYYGRRLMKGGYRQFLR